MTYLSFMEKLNILFDTMMDFYFILVFSVLLMILTFMYIAKKITIKKYSLLMLLSFIIVFCISIISNYDVLSNTFDNFTTIFFGNIYFPSIYVYIGVLVISFIAFMTSSLNVMLKKIYKIINSIMFVLNNLLFVIIINIIAKNNIDIFSINSLYTNTSLVAMLELSMGLFIIWVLSLITVYITNSICERLAVKRVHKEEIQEEIFSPLLEVSNDIINNVNTLNDNDMESVVVEAVSNTVEVESKQEIHKNKFIFKEISSVNDDVIKEDTSNVTFNDILNGTIPVTYYDNSYINNEYDLVNPQIVYENNYDKAKNDSIIFNNIEVNLDDMEEVVAVNSALSQEDVQLSVEELTLKEKEKVSEERLLINTISLNDLIDDEDNVSEVEINTDNNVNVLEVEEGKESYTLDDYKKFIKMLNELKNYSNTSNINIDDAVAISLISNYSIDDCMKFKNILENNLN